MKNQLWIVVLMLSVLLLAACGDEEPQAVEPTVANEPTAIRLEDETTNADVDPTNTPEPEPTEMVESDPTSTPLPEPTNTPQPEPTNTPEPTEVPVDTTSEALGPDALSFIDEVSGISFQYPADWTAENLISSVIFASNMGFDEGADDEVAGMLMFVLPNEDGKSLDEWTDEGFGQLGFVEDELEILGEAEPVELGGLPGQRTLFLAEESDLTLEGSMTVVQSETATFIFAALTPDVIADVNQPILDGILQTLVLSEPDFELLDETGEPGASEGPELADAVPNVGVFDQIVAIDSNQVNTFSFELEAGTTYLFYAQPAFAVDLVMTLLDAAESTIVNRDDALSSEAEYIVFAAEESGPYTVAVSSFFDDTVQFSLIATALGEGISAEIPQSSTAPLEIASSDVPQLVYAVAGPDDDLWLESSGALYADLGSGGDPDLLVVPANTTDTISAGNFGSEPITVRYSVIPLDDSFVVGLGEDVDSGDTVEEPAEALPPVEATLDTAYTDAAASAVTYQFALEANQSYFVHSQPDADSDSTLTLYGPDGNVLDSSDSGFAGEAETIVLTAEAAGVYEVVVEGFVGAFRASTFVTAIDTVTEMPISGDDVADITVPATESETLLLVVPSGEIDIVLTLTDGTEIDVNAVETEESVIIPAGSAEQTISVSLWSDADGAFSFYVAPLPSGFAVFE